MGEETTTHREYYAWGGSAPVVEYTEATASSTPEYSRSYVYAGSRLLSTATKVSTTAETTEFHHPDRLGTRLVTNPGAGTYYQQSTLPFGTALGAESTGFSNQVFTSYDRSASTGLDYAVNRTYSQGQSRFTQVDPIGMSALALAAAPFSRRGRERSGSQDRVSQGVGGQPFLPADRKAIEAINKSG